MTRELNGTSDDVSVPALARVLAGERSEHVVRETLRAHRELDEAGRARVARRVHGASVLRARLAFLSAPHAGLVGPPDAGALEAPALVDAYVRFEEERTPVDVTWPLERIARMRVERSAPAFMVADLVDALGVDGADAFLAASNVPAPATLRANTLRTTRDALRERLRAEGIVTQPSPIASTALVVEGRANLFGSPSWRDGWFEVQDASSQACIEACAARPGDVVVDLCAGRGGKTLGLAASMQNEGSLYVHDVDARALADLRPRLVRAGVTCVRPLDDAIARDGSATARDGSADLVLVDAPCSSWGPLRRSPDLRWTQTDDDVAPLPALQRSLLARAAALVKPGGRVVYATCTVRRAENEDVVVADALLTLEATRTLLPHIDGCDGFFFAVLRRT